MAASPSLAPVLAPRYYSRFGCIGGACENTCCTGWAIEIDADHHRRVREALSHTKADREMFAASFKRNRTNPSKNKHALIVLNPTTGYCNLLGDDGLCGLHKRFGEKVLPDVCATYPRRQSLVGNRVEAATVLSCPEAARQALLPADAMELIDLDGSVVGRQVFVQIAANEGDNDYAGALDVVRAGIMQIIAGAPSLSAGLATVAALADVLGDDFSRAKANAGGVDPQLVVSTLEEFARPARSQQIGRDVGAIDVPLSMPIFTLLQILAARKACVGGKVDQLLEHVSAAYGIGEEAIVGEVVKAFTARREASAKHVEARLGQILSNYALNHTFTHWYTTAPDLGIWARGLILRVALVRFLVYAHPAIAALADDASEADACAAVEKVAVDVVHKFARTLEHHKAFLQMLDEQMPSAMPGIEHALCLLKV